MSSYFNPKQHNRGTLNYIKNNFIVDGGTVKRKDGYIGTWSVGYRSFTIPAWASGMHWSEGRVRALAHHISWFLHYGEWPQYELDHFDDNRQNNSIDNLREVKGEHRKEQNDYERKSKAKGYYLDRRYGTYSCIIRVNRKSKAVGRVKTEAEAIRKVALARMKLLNDWEEPFADTKSFPLYMERKGTHGAKVKRALTKRHDSKITSGIHWAIYQGHKRARACIYECSAFVPTS